MKTTTTDFKKRLIRIQRLAETGKVDRSLASLEKMLRKWPDHPVLLMEKARLIQLSDHGDLAEAKRALKRAAEVDATSPDPWTEMGYYLLVIDDRARAAEEKFDHAIRLGIRMLTEAVTGKIEAMLDQTDDGWSASRVSEAQVLLECAQFLARRCAGDSLWECRLREQLAELRQHLRGVSKPERNGK